MSVRGFSFLAQTGGVRCWPDFDRQIAQYPLEDGPGPFRATRASAPPLGQHAGDAGVDIVHEGVGGNDLEPRQELNKAVERAVSSNTWAMSAAWFQPCGKARS